MIWKNSSFFGIIHEVTLNQPPRHPVISMAHLIYLMAELEWDGWFGIDTLLLNINLAGFEYCLYFKHIFCIHILTGYPNAPKDHAGSEHVH